MNHIIIGTAGHIDHGKSALVKALTGVDPDRLQEEKERGMTIDLGFAFLSDEIAFVDVPGHEKFIKNMVAGVSGIDMALFVIAADDGIMPQTREHLDILSLLQLEKGIIAVTKSDLVDQDWLELVEEDIRNLVAGSFLKKAPILKVSSVSGEGLESLKAAIFEMVASIDSRPDRGFFWMPVDRAFTMKGFGTVITGSVLSGGISISDTVELLPAQKELRIRGLQAHGRNVDFVKIGDRAALNIANIGKGDFRRGDVVATAKIFSPSLFFNVKFQLLKSAKKPLQNRTRIRAHVGAREVMARIKLLDCLKVEPGETCYAQLQFEQRVVALKRDPFVVRSYSPPFTIGGGIILDTNPPKQRRFNAEELHRLKSKEQLDPNEIVEETLLAYSERELSMQDIAKLSGMSQEQVQKIVQDLVGEKLVIQFQKPALSYYHEQNLQSYMKQIINSLDKFHQDEPLRPGMNKAQLKETKFKSLSMKVFNHAIQYLIKVGEIIEKTQIIKRSGYKITLSAQDKALHQSITDLVMKKRFEAPTDKEICQSLNISINDGKRILGAMQGMGEIYRMEGDLYFHKNILNEVKAQILKLAQEKKEFTVSDFRIHLGVSRKYALAFLNYFDQSGFTQRIGDVRVVS